MIAISATAAIGTEMYSETPRKPSARLTPMNSVTIVRKFSRKRSPTEKKPQKRPKRSLMSFAWPTPVTAPSRTTISWLTTQHGDQQQQHPQQARAVVLARLRVGRDAAGVVVADHHDQARADDREQREQPRAQRCGEPPRARGSSRTRPGCRRRARSRARRACARASKPAPASGRGLLAICSTSFLRRARSLAAAADGGPQRAGSASGVRVGARHGSRGPATSRRL